MRHRRRIARREKRKMMLRACVFLEPLVSISKCPSQASPENRWRCLVGKITRDTKQDRCREIMESHFLSGLYRTNGLLRNTCMTRGAKRLQRQIHAVANVA